MNAGFSPGWGAACHEGSHVTVALRLGSRVLSASVSESHAGLTQAIQFPWRGVLSAVAGLEGEKLLLPPSVVEPWRSEPDMRHARECALALVAGSESRRAARYLAQPSSPTTAARKPTPTQRPDPEAVAFVAAFEKAREGRREERARKLIEYGKTRARRLLSANILVIRTIAVRLSHVGVIGEDELLALFAEGRARQIEDDERLRRKT